MRLVELGQAKLPMRRTIDLLVLTILYAFAQPISQSDIGPLSALFDGLGLSVLNLDCSLAESNNAFYDISWVWRIRKRNEIMVLRPHGDDFTHVG